MISLVIGSQGFCGKRLTAKLRALADISVIGADIHEIDACDTQLDGYFTLDITDGRQMLELVERVRPDWVFNLSGLTAGPAQTIYGVNVIGNINLFEAIRLAKPDARVLVVGSAAEYGMVDQLDNPIAEDHPCMPVSHYGTSKHAATLASMSYVKQFGIQITIMRPFNIIGPGTPNSLVLGATISRAIDALKSADPVIKIGNLDAERDFLDVEDVADAYILAIQSDCWGEAINICSGKPCSIRAIVEGVLSCAPQPIRLEVDPSLYKPVDVPVIYGNRHLAERRFGFIPRIGLHESLERAWRLAAG